MVCIYRPKLEDDNALDKRFQIDSSYEMNNLYFHRQAVFASCSDGIVRLLDGSQLIHRKSSVHSDIHVKKIIETSAQFISNVNFNLRHNLLTISTEKVKFYCQVSNKIILVALIINIKKRAFT